MDFVEFVADFSKECLFEVATDADADFVFVIGFDDFSAGVTIGEDDTFFPDKIAFDEPMHFDGEAGEYSFGHEVVVVAQDEVGGVVPLILRGISGEHLGDDVGAGDLGDFVAEFEVFHELKQFGTHVAVLIVCPDCSEVGLCEVAEVLLNFFVVKDFVDSGGAPFGFENDQVF